MTTLEQSKIDRTGHGQMSDTTANQYEQSIWHRLNNDPAPITDFDQSKCNGNGATLAEAVGIHSDGLQNFLMAKPDLLKLSPELAIYEQVRANNPFTNITDLDGMPSTVWLVDEHLQQGGVTVIYAPPGAGKSFFSLDLSFQVAKQDKRVVYVAPEGRTGYRKRTKAYMQHHKVKTDQIDFVFGNQLDMLDDENVTLFIEQIRFSGGASLIVLDTLASLNTGDENSAKDMQAFMRACGRLQDELDAAVLIVHHTGKSGSSERGSSALRGAADVMIELTNEDSIIKVSCSKSKDSEGFATYYLRLVQIDLGNDENSAVLLPSDKVVTLDSDALTERQQEVVDWLAEFWEDGARTSDLREALNMPRSTLFATLKTLKRRGIIDRDGKYDPYILTVKGHEYATVQKSKAVQLDQLDPIDASLV